MAHQLRFNKILTLKEREKDSALAAYYEARKKFEAAAEKLYELLKQKENMEVHQSSKLANGLPVQEIRHYQQFIGNMQKTIDHYQKMVINARNRMNFQQEQLLEKNIEVKKYEKIRELQFNRMAENLKLEENRQMDDISIQQYMSRGN